MAYRIEVTRRAEADALEAADTIARDSIPAAARWFQGLERVFASLAESPSGFSTIAESPVLEHTYRSVRHYSHRVVFRVDEEARTVFIVRVYHGARRPLIDEDLLA